MKETRAVIFDMDGVIVDSEPRHERAFLDVVSEIGYGQTHGIKFADYVGRSDHELWVDFVAKHKPSCKLEELLAMKRQRVVEIIRRERPLFEGLLELLQAIAPRHALALASGSERAVVDEVLNLGDLRRFFPVTVSASEIKRGKPAPDIFLRAAELLAVAPADCWVIEDSKPGIAAGKSAGMRVIAVTNTHPAAELREADFVVSGYAEIATILGAGP
ncbi:MAG TPA: HAD family phosphatase [Verrucomicrobiae bacterium]